MTNQKRFTTIAQWESITRLPMNYYGAARGMIAWLYFEELRKLQDARDEKIHFEDRNCLRPMPDGVYRDAVEFLVLEIGRQEELVERLKMEWERMKREGLERSE